MSLREWQYVVLGGWVRGSVYNCTCDVGVGVWVWMCVCVCACVGGWVGGCACLSHMCAPMCVCGGEEVSVYELHVWWCGCAQCM